MKISKFISALIVALIALQIIYRLSSGNRFPFMVDAGNDAAEELGWIEIIDADWEYDSELKKNGHFVKAKFSVENKSSHNICIPEVTLQEGYSFNSGMRGDSLFIFPLVKKSGVHFARQSEKFATLRPGEVVQNELYFGPFHKYPLFSFKYLKAQIGFYSNNCMPLTHHEYESILLVSNKYDLGE